MANELFSEAYVAEAKIGQYEKRGYPHDLLPKGKDERTMGVKNYFTLWMGLIHNIPNYTAMVGVLTLGLAPMNIILAVILSAVVVAFFMVFMGVPGSKYGIPFAMHLRSVYGETGAKLPGFLRGVIASIGWFAIQNFSGAMALLVIISKLYPPFLTLGGNMQVLGANIPLLLSFTLFWFINVLIGLGGGELLNKFTAFISPLIYIVFIGMTIWALQGAGIERILAYNVNVESSQPVLLLTFVVINLIASIWSAPSVNVADFTQNAKTTKAQAIGQSAGLLIGYTLFAFASVIVLIGGSIIYNVGNGEGVLNLTQLIERWDAVPLTILAGIVFLLTTISTNASANIIPAGYQLEALFPKQLNYKRAIWLAGIISYIILPWKLMENPSGILLFLSVIGATLGPVGGVMFVHYYFVTKQDIDIDALYIDDDKNNDKNPYHGINMKAYIATIVGLVLALVGLFIPQFKVIADLSWIISALVSGLLYYVLTKIIK